MDPIGASRPFQYEVAGLGSSHSIPPTKEYDLIDHKLLQALILGPRDFDAADVHRGRAPQQRLLDLIALKPLVGGVPRRIVFT